MKPTPAKAPPSKAPPQSLDFFTTVWHSPLSVQLGVLKQMMAMRSLRLGLALLHVASHVFVLVVFCMDKGEHLASTSSWQHELDLAHNSGVHPSTFSSDDVLVSAGADLDHGLELLREKAELTALLTELRQYEKNYERSFHQGAISYVPHNRLDLSPAEIAVAMKEHFRPPHRNIAMLNDGMVITANIHRPEVSRTSQRWKLNKGDSHVFFWEINSEKTEVAFKGLATVAPPAVIRHFFTELSRLTPASGERWDYRKFVFKPPNRLNFLLPLVPKAV